MKFKNQSLAGCTVALIKSKAIADGHAGSIIQTIIGCRKQGDEAVPTNGHLAIAHAEALHLSKEQAEAFYGEHAGRSYFPGLIESVTGPEGVIAMVLTSRNSSETIKVWRGMMGPTDPNKARAEAPHSIRALYATEMPHTAVHGSDSQEAVEREVAIIWPNDVEREMSITPSDDLEAE